MVSDVVDSPTTTKALKDDWGKTLRFLGLPPGTKLADIHKLAWAIAVETFMMEGMSPSRRLAKVFEGYTPDAGPPAVVLDDEIRGVIRRTLATDEEIATMDVSALQAQP